MSIGPGEADVCQDKTFYLKDFNVYQTFISLETPIQTYGILSKTKSKEMGNLRFYMVAFCVFASFRLKEMQQGRHIWS